MKTTLHSDTWIALGRLLFGNGPFVYWCPTCKTEFSSRRAPDTCPEGCVATDQPDDSQRQVMHKGVGAATFRFSTRSADGERMSM